MAERFINAIFTKAAGQNAFCQFCLKDFAPGEEAIVTINRNENPHYKAVCDLECKAGYEELVKFEELSYG